MIVSFLIYILAIWPVWFDLWKIAQLWKIPAAHFDARSVFPQSSIVLWNWIIKNAAIRKVLPITSMSKEYEYDNMISIDNVGGK